MALDLRHSLSSDDWWCVALVEHRRKLSLLIEVLAETSEMLSNAIDTYIVDFNLFYCLFDFCKWSVKA